MSARRAERELREEKERALRLEREIDSLKARGVVGGGLRSSGTFIKPQSAWTRERMGSDSGIEVPKRKSSISRQMSMTKGFL